MFVAVFLISGVVISDTALSQTGGKKKKATVQPTATPVSLIKIKKDFKVELLYSVPPKTQGSWVSMCVDPKGRLIVSDQDGKLYRVTPPPLGQSAGIKVEPINVAIGEAQGLLWAFDSLYVVVNQARKYSNGLYRVRSSHGDDNLDKLEKLADFAPGGGEHGPHAVLLGPDGKSLISARPAITRSSSRLSVPGCRVFGARISFCRGNGTQAAMPKASSPPAAGSASAIRTARTGNSSPWVIATSTTPPSTARASCSPTIPTWNGILTRPGIAPRACVMPSMAASSAGAPAPACIPTIIRITFRRS